MAKKPRATPEEIVEFILAGNTTKEAVAHFGFSSENSANNRIWSAFKKLDIKRPRYSEEKKCLFCETIFIARSRNQVTCGAKECQNAFIVQWNKDNPNSSKKRLRQNTVEPINDGYQIKEQRQKNTNLEKQGLTHKDGLMA